MMRKVIVLQKRQKNKDFEIMLKNFLRESSKNLNQLKKRNQSKVQKGRR